MADGIDRLYQLLPAVYRERDATEGYPLRALLRVVTEQADLVEHDVATLWNDLFIETCRPWVIPYLGDLVSNRLLYDDSRADSDRLARQLFRDLTGPDLRPPIAIRTRADVAKTIYYRRRKGTLPMLEELARDVTGWAAHAVEFFELLGWNQHLEHLRFQSAWTDVRSVERMDRVHGPFDPTSHTVDVRRIAPDEGWHNIPNVGFFLYRLGSYPLGPVPARQAASADWRYHFSPLGNPAPLFSRWRREGDEAGLATELHVPAPIRRSFFHQDLVRYRDRLPPRSDFTDLYGLPDPIDGDPTGVCRECSFFIVRNGEPVTPAVDPTVEPDALAPQIVCRQLDDWPAVQPSGRILGVDVDTGRIVVGDGWGDDTDSLDVYFHYGFAADLGGGPYERQKWLVRPDLGGRRLFVRQGVAEADTFPTVDDALQAWAAPAIDRADTVITILDSRSYQLPAQIELPNEGSLVIEAANGERPLLATPAGGLEVQVSPPAVVGDPDRQASLTLGGVVVEGHLEVTGDLGRLRLIHTTLIPGRRLQEDGDPATGDPSLVVEAGAPGAELNAQLRVEIAFSILGAVVVPEHAEGVWLLDSILDGLDPANAAYGGGAGLAGPDLHLERVTVFGEIDARSLEMSESIATGVIDTVRTQSGCVRFSYVVPGSRTPRRFRCQPELAVERAREQALERNPDLSPADLDQIGDAVSARLVPAFTTERYGRPEYAQLRLSSPVEIRTGAEDGSEMGAYCHLKQPQRISNLRLRLDEYLPFGREAGILFAT